MPRKSRRGSGASKGSGGSGGNLTSSIPLEKSLSEGPKNKRKSGRKHHHKEDEQWAPALTEEQAAAKIQNFLAGKKEQTQKQKEIKAAIKIQAAVRGRNLRKSKTLSAATPKPGSDDASKMVVEHLYRHAAGEPDPQPAMNGVDSQELSTFATGTVLIVPHGCYTRAKMMMGVVSWLLDTGSKVVVWTGGANATLVPSKATVLSTNGMDRLDEIVADFEKPFREANIRKSTQLNYELDIRSVWRPLKSELANVIRENKPNAVLVDATLASQDAWIAAKDVSSTFFSLNTAGRPHAGCTDDETSSDGEELDAVESTRTNDTKESQITPLAKTQTGFMTISGDRSLSLWPKLIAGARALVKEKAKDNEVFVGPMCTSSPGDVPGEVGEWIKSSEDPLVLVDFGDLPLLGDKLIDKVCKGLLNGKWRVLWKLRRSEQEFFPADVKSGKATNPESWKVVTELETAAALNCPQVKCFITSCGADVVYQAMMHAIPCVCVPILQNQYKWAESLSTQREMGIQLGKMSLNMATLSRAIAECFTSGFMKRNAQLCQKELLEFEDDVKATLGLPADGSVGGAVVGAILTSVVSSEQVTALQNEYVDPPPEVQRVLTKGQDDKQDEEERPGVSRGRSGILVSRSQDSVPNYDTIYAGEMELQRTLLIDAPPEKGDPDYVEPKKPGLCDQAQRGCANCSIM